MPVELNGRTLLYPIIGDPVAYAESPARLSATFAGRGHDGVCVPLRVPRDALETVMDALGATPNVAGLLVTMPHKEAVSAFCATRSDQAALLGVTSVLRRNEDGSWHGDMLDGDAFVKAQVDQGATPAGARVLILGAGGAGSAIAAAMVRAGVAEVALHDTDQARAARVVDLVGRLAHAVCRVADSADPTRFDLVCNATPMGMEDDDPLPVDPALLRATMFIGDVIAGHGTTRLVAAARAAGCGTATGAHMVEAVQDVMADFFLDGHD